MQYSIKGIVWLNVCMAVGMSLCTFTGAIKINLTLFDFSIAFPAANLIFAFMTFPATDILADVYGKKIANQAVWIGYASQAITVLVIRLMVLLPGETSVFVPFAKTGPYIFLASSIAYLTAQFWDVFIFHFIKEHITGPSHLWLRNNLSTMSSQVINSIIFISMVFGIQQLPVLLGGSLIVKLAAALIDTPFVYLGCAFLRRSENSCEAVPAAGA